MAIFKYLFICHLGYISLSAASQHNTLRTKWKQICLEQLEPRCIKYEHIILKSGKGTHEKWLCAVTINLSIITQFASGIQVFKPWPFLIKNSKEKSKKNATIFCAPDRLLQHRIWPITSANNRQYTQYTVHCDIRTGCSNIQFLHNTAVVHSCT